MWNEERGKGWSRVGRVREEKGNGGRIMEGERERENPESRKRQC